jgi:hypothetical protein
MRSNAVFCCVRGQPGLQSEFQDSQSYIEKPCLKKKKKKKKKGELSRLNNKTNKQTVQWAGKVAWQIRVCTTLARGCGTGF